MSRAIIDNATLTAVQRLLGEIPIYNKHTIDGDILAFETFIQAILFHDDICYVFALLSTGMIASYESDQPTNPSTHQPTNLPVK